MFNDTVETKRRNLALRLRHTRRNRQQSLLERGVERVAGHRYDNVH